MEQSVQTILNQITLHIPPNHQEPKIEIKPYKVSISAGQDSIMDACERALDD